LKERVVHDLKERVVHDGRRLNRAETRRSKSFIFLPTILEGCVCSSV
jgi:hypothetical protein